MAARSRRWLRNFAPCRHHVCRELQRQFVGSRIERLHEERIAGRNDVLALEFIVAVFDAAEAHVGPCPAPVVFRHVVVGERGVWKGCVFLVCQCQVVRFHHCGVLCEELLHVKSADEWVGHKEEAHTALTFVLQGHGVFGCGGRWSQLVGAQTTAVRKRHGVLGGLAGYRSWPLTTIFHEHAHTGAYLILLRPVPDVVVVIVFRQTE